MEKLRKQNGTQVVFPQAIFLGILLLAMTACLFFIRLGSYPLFNPDEALYAEPAREMLQTHNYLTTTLNYQNRFTKPPLCIWMEALSYKVFGVSEFSARFFSAACAVVTVMTVFIFLLPYVRSVPAFLGACSLLSAPMFVVVGRMSITDMPLTLFISGSLLGLFTAYRSGNKQLPLVAYVLMGLAVITKGPIGVVLPVVIITIYHLLNGDLKTALKIYRPLTGAVIVAAIALPWFVAEVIVTHGEYFNSFVVRENFQRFTQVVDSHHGAWWYHLAAVAMGFSPWIVFIPQALIRIPKVFGNISVRAFQGVIKHEERSELLLFSGITACFAVLFFSLSASKLLPYTLPAFPALACLVALELDYIFEHKLWRRLVAPVTILLISLSAAGLLMPQLFSKLRHVPNLLQTCASEYIASQVLLLVVVLLFLLLPLSKKIAVILLFAGEIGAFAYFGGSALSYVSRLWEGPIPGLSRMAAATGEPIFVYRMRKVSVPFYAGRATVLSPNQEFLTTTVEQELPKYPRACIIASVFDLKFFSGDARFRLVKRLGDYVLIEWMGVKARKKSLDVP